MSRELPEGWAMAPLGTLGRYVNGRAFKPKEWEKEGLPIIRIQNLNDASARFNYSSNQHDERFKVRNGDLLIAWSASLGAFVWQGGDAWLNQHIFRVEHNNLACTKEYLLYAVRHAIDELYDKAHGTGMVHVTKPIFEAHAVPLPPRPEQQRIVEQLERVLDKVVVCRERLDRITLILKRFRQSVLRAACSGTLTEDWRTYNTPPKERNTTSELHPNWRSVAVGDVIEDIKYGTSKKCSYEKTGAPVLRIPNVVSGTITDADLKYAHLPSKELANLRLRIGDILIIRSNGSVALVGKCAIVREKHRDFAYAGYLIRIRPDHSAVEPDFLKLALDNYDVRVQIELQARSTSGVNNINSSEVRALTLALPPLPEQQEIVRRVNALFALADQIHARYEKAMSHVENLTPSVLKKALHGELVPTEAELAAKEGRDFESADELLERISKAKASRARTAKTQSRREHAVRRKVSNRQQ